jgi:hypothetical protein
MKTVKTTVEIYRFHDWVAFSLGSAPGVTYVDCAGARTLAAELQRFAQDLDDVPKFHHSTIDSREFEIETKPS